MHLHLLSVQVSDTMLSIATLTGEPLDKMTSPDGAPKIIATLVGKGGDFSNDDGQQEGVPVMPQVRVVVCWGGEREACVCSVCSASRPDLLRVHL